MLDKYQQGQFYIAGLEQALTFGIKRWADDTESRSEFIEKHGELFCGAMLVSTFACLESLSFIESTPSNSWIECHGKKQTEELAHLKLIRNAFVHTNSNIKKLRDHTEAKENELRKFIQDMKDGKITDDKDIQYKCYIELDENGVVKFNEHAIRMFACIGKAIISRAKNDSLMNE